MSEQIRESEERDLRAHVTACAGRYATLFGETRKIKRLAWLVWASVTPLGLGVIYKLGQIEGVLRSRGLSLDELPPP